MHKDYRISIFLDKRRIKLNGKYPVKLRVFMSSSKKQKLYNTQRELTEVEFKNIWEVQRTKEEFKEIKRELNDLLNYAEDIAKKINPFSFDLFEKKMLLTKGEETTIEYHYKEKIKKELQKEHFSTASNYQSSLKSIKGYVEYQTGVLPEKILFSEITPEWLFNYEQYMTSEMKKSETTVSMYLRALRTLFNTAITEKEINSEIYPFGVGKYNPPATRKVKKTFNDEILNRLFYEKTQNAEQEKARNYFFFSFFCNGINMIDIANLTFDKIIDNRLVYYRIKTRNTAKKDLRPIQIYLNDDVNEIIRKYSNIEVSGSDFIFPIISHNLTPKEKHLTIKNFTNSINKHLKKFAKSIGVTDEISTYWARHSYAGKLIREGYSMEFVGESLDHSGTRVTQNYFSGFEDVTKKEVSKKLMNFKNESLIKNVNN